MLERDRLAGMDLDGRREARGGWIADLDPVGSRRQSEPVERRRDAASDAIDEDLAPRRDGEQHRAAGGAPAGSVAAAIDGGDASPIQPSPSAIAATAPATSAAASRCGAARRHRDGGGEGKAAAVATLAGAVSMARALAPAGACHGRKTSTAPSSSMIVAGPANEPIRSIDGSSDARRRVADVEAAPVGALAASGPSARGTAAISGFRRRPAAGSRGSGGSGISKRREIVLMARSLPHRQPRRRGANQKSNGVAAFRRREAVASRRLSAFARAA